MGTIRNDAPPPEVAAYYASYPEETRLGSGASRLEFERTKAILARALPRPPARILDIGGAAGAYSFWLAEHGYEVHLIDAAPRLVEEARKRNATHARPIAKLSVADARALPEKDGSAAAALLLGPLYHLTEAPDRMAALREARRVVAPAGVVAAAAISRYASAMDGLARHLTSDPRFVQIRDQDLATGQHRNETERVDYFTTAYFHRPEDLRAEMEQSGFREVRILGVEGPGWILSDFDRRWDEPAMRKELLEVAGRFEEEPSILGASAHLIGIGRS